MSVVFEHGDKILDVDTVEMEFANPNDTMLRKTINFTDYLDGASHMTFHKLNITVAYSSVTIEMSPSVNHYVYVIFARRFWTPTKEVYDYRTEVLLIDDQDLNVMIPGEIFDNTGIYYIGIQHGNTTASK